MKYYYSKESPLRTSHSFLLLKNADLRLYLTMPLTQLLEIKRLLIECVPQRETVSLNCQLVGIG